MERGEQVIAVEIGSTGNGRNSMINGGRQPSYGGTSRMNREVHVRICERLGVQLPGATRLTAPGTSDRAVIWKVIVGAIVAGSVITFAAG